MSFIVRRRTRLEAEDGRDGAVGERRSLLRTLHQLMVATIRHDSKAYKVWWTFTLVLVVVTIAALPLQLGFFSGIEPAVRRHGYETFEHFMIGLDVCFLLDVLVNLKLTYEDERTGRVVDHPGEIAAQYLSNMFVPDILAIVPFELLGLPTELQPLGLLRFLRVRRLLTFFGILESSVHVERAPVAVAKFLLLLISNAHLAGCLMHYSLVRSIDNCEKSTKFLTELHVDASCKDEVEASTMLGLAGYGPFGEHSEASLFERYVLVMY